MSLDFTNDQSTLVQVMVGAVRQQAITWTSVDQDLHILYIVFCEATTPGILVMS